MSALRGIIISPSAELRTGLEALIAETGRILLVRSVDHYLTIEELDSLLRAYSPQVVFLDISSEPSAIQVAARLAGGGALPVAVHARCEPRLLMEVMHAGVHEFLYPPFARDLFLQALDRLAKAARELPRAVEGSELIYGFLPAKAGSGCSTLVVNTARALAGLERTRTLLLDFDISAGVVGFLLKLNAPFSVPDALQHSNELDEGMWDEMVTPVGDLHALGTGPVQPAFSAEPMQLRRLLDFCRRRYKVVCLDLGGNLEPYELDLLRECRRIVLVISPDLSAVYLAREKMRLLHKADLDDRVLPVLSRWHKDMRLSFADIETALGLPIEHILPEDSAVVYQSVLTGSPLKHSAPFARAVARFAESLADSSSRKARPPKRMVEYFTVTPSRYTLFSRK